MIIIDNTMLSALSSKAKEYARRRLNLNFHTKDEDNLQRLLNAIEPDTYIQPHKHDEPDKREVFIILTGKAAILCFDDFGGVTQHTILSRDKGVFAVEIPPKTWHTLVSLEEGTVLYELKDGPYDVKNDKQFAPWAPAEGDVLCKTFLNKIKTILFT